MNILDENIADNQRVLLLRWHISVHQIGYDIAHKGIKDREIIPFLHALRRPTFFTRDADFYRRELDQAEYCLVLRPISQLVAADSVRRVLRHPEFNTVAKRMGTVMRVAPPGLTVWRMYAQQEVTVSWPARGR